MQSVMVSDCHVKTASIICLSRCRARC